VDDTQAGPVHRRRLPHPAGPGPYHPAWAASSALYALPIFVLSGETTAWVADRLRDAHEALALQAYRDTLTGLANRAELHARAEAALARARRNTTAVGLLFVDLDRFKTVNDTLGHEVGDELLRAVAPRLRAAVRTQDTVARLGGDEFALLLPDAADSRAIEAFTRRIATEIKRPYDIDHQRVTVSASLGISTIEPDDDYEAFLHRADLAMYKAKRDKAA